MNETGQHNYFSAQLQINTQTGEVRHATGNDASVRLSPVNCRVLLVLIQNAGKAVSRQQLFDAVWPNQVVSDDALTRCISDLRAQLKPLTEVTPLIGTIPKVGYRWLSDVTENQTNPNDDNDGDNKSIGEAPNNEKESLWSRQLKPMLWALGLLLLLVWSLMAGLYWWFQPTGTSVVILPTQSVSPAINGQSVSDVAHHLKQATKVHDNINYLSQFAVQSHNGSPFPYFSHEFGVRWFIESRIEHQATGQRLTLNLIDAKTALVTYSQQFTITPETSLDVHCQSFIDFVAGL
ncbi:winged helix-turn-helix domain-containing protein [Marinicella rhabdoformis]|uniref:winged helix-turn-helix domain-containing protein n=1 Tax=Marinicella rhabdoformis TaxID=2580566 RepID=UPI0012AEDB61|nr:winged helix-turn-helix domain-containing protein [Marinicella rhabdoformis]